MPRFSEAHRLHNQEVVRNLAEAARARGVSRTQLAIAWALNKHPGIVPVIGARTPVQLDEALGALGIRMTTEEVSDLEALIPAASIQGTRYPELQMKMLDSERE